jgi:gamma-glutamylcyclotransferase (GGCT)/AIG2-like uncharacterized protein YtfP
MPQVGTINNCDFPKIDKTDSPLLMKTSVSTFPSAAAVAELASSDHGNSQNLSSSIMPKDQIGAVQRRKRWWIMSACYLSALPLCHAFQTAAPNSSPSFSATRIINPSMTNNFPMTEEGSNSNWLLSSSTTDGLEGTAIHVSDNFSPSMFLHGPRRSIGVSKRSASSIQLPPYLPGINTDSSAVGGRVLGFDIFSRSTTATLENGSKGYRRKMTTTSLAASFSKSNVNIPVWNREQRQNFSFLGSPMWNQQSDMWTFEEEDAAATSTTTSTPSWFPWIPTRLQIERLKVTEMRYACAQRGLKKVS